MSDQRITWGFIRRIYLAVGIVAAVGAALSFAWPGTISPFLSAVIAVLVLGVAFLASDDLLQRVHRIFWRREWPK
jgi:hypothetical protein